MAEKNTPWSTMTPEQKTDWAESCRSKDKHMARFTAGELVQYRELRWLLTDIEGELRGLETDAERAAELVEDTRPLVRDASARLANYQAVIEAAADARGRLPAPSGGEL